jgi:hypothetical protein
MKKINMCSFLGEIEGLFLAMSTIENSTIYIVETDREKEPTIYVGIDKIQEIRAYEFNNGHLYGSIASGLALKQYPVTNSVKLTAEGKKRKKEQDDKNPMNPKKKKKEEKIPKWVPKPELTLHSIPITVAYAIKNKMESTKQTIRPIKRKDRNKKVKKVIGKPKAKSMYKDKPKRLS